VRAQVLRGFRSHRHVDVNVVALLIVGACHELALESHLMGTAQEFAADAAAQQIGTSLATLLTGR